MTHNQEVEFIELGNRLDQIRRHYRLSQKKLAELVEGNQAGVSSVLSGKRKIPKIWYIQLEKKYTDLNIDWLRTGEGEMLKSAGGISTDVISEPSPPEYGNGRELTSTEMERMMTRLTYELTTIRANLEAIEMWREQMTKHMGRVLGYLNEIDGLKKAGKWPK